MISLNQVYRIIMDMHQVQRISSNPVSGSVQVRSVKEMIEYSSQTSYVIDESYSRHERKW